MKGFILSFRSEFYKTRKTMGFWSAILLPLLICLLLFVGFFNKSDHLANLPGLMAWLQFAGAILPSHFRNSATAAGQPIDETLAARRGLVHRADTERHAPAFAVGCEVAGLDPDIIVPIPVAARSRRE